MEVAKICKNESFIHGIVQKQKEILAVFPWSHLGLQELQSGCVISA